MASTDRSRQRHGLIRGLRTEWRQIGGMGRVAVIGLGAAIVLTIVMGFTITATARSNLLNARADLIATEVGALPALTPDDRPGSAVFAEFTTAVQHELLGGETERIKVWATDGRILYSDNSDLIGDRFDLSAPAVAAFGGATATQVSDLSDPAHAGERSLGELIEVYVPRPGPDGSVVMVVEVEQRLDSLNEAMGDIRRSVWLGIGFGVGVLAVFLSALGISIARGVNRRRVQAERLLAAVFRAQEEERRRIVGALHDDIGQPLYRLLYGLEGSRAKLGADEPVTEEIERLEDVVRSIDGTLRGELEHLYQGLAADAGLATAVRDLAATTESESGMDVHVAIEGDADELTPVGRTALFRAAQEAVVNVRKHAGARNVWIRLAADKGRVVVVVEDDGIGVSSERGLGLSTTQERIEALGGAVQVRKRRSGGTVFTAWLPPGESAT